MDQINLSKAQSQGRVYVFGQPKPLRMKQIRPKKHPV